MSETPLRDDGVTMTCPICQGAFAPSGRRVYCSSACKQVAYRHRQGSELVAVNIPDKLPRRPLTVYECDTCGARAVGEQRCPDCGTFMSRLDFGGFCPHCEGPVALLDLLPQEVLPKTMH